MEEIITKDNQSKKALSIKQKIIISVIFLILGLGIFAVAFNFKKNNIFLGLNNQTILDYFINLRTEKFTNIFTLITNLFSPTNIIIAIGLATIFWIIIKKETIRPLLFGGSIFVSSALSYILKDFIKNPRPPQISMVSPFELDYSFPSGHTISVVVLTLVLGYLIYSRTYKTSRLINWLLLSIVSITLIATSRLYLGYHWLSDIFASLGLGLITVSLTIAIDIIIEKVKNKKLQ